MVWDGAEAAALFSSGMGAISSACLAFLRPGDTLLFSDPVYGGTEYLFRRILPGFGIRTVPFPAGADEAALAAAVKAHGAPRLVFLESPANPTMQLCDIAAAGAVADRRLHAGAGPAWSSSTTPSSGPSSAGRSPSAPTWSSTRPPSSSAATRTWWPGSPWGGPRWSIRSRGCAPSSAPTSDPDTAWLISRSLGTLQLRMEQQQRNAGRLVELLRTPPDGGAGLLPRACRRWGSGRWRSGGASAAAPAAWSPSTCAAARPRPSGCSTRSATCAWR